MATTAKDSKKDYVPYSQTPGSKTITITVPDISVNLADPKHKFRLALLLILALIFLFTLFMFTRSSFSINDIFNIARLQYNIGKLYSISFTLFMILFSLCMGLAVYYGFGASRLDAALALIEVIALAVVYSIFNWAYAYAFLGFAAAIACAAVLASLSKEQNLSAAWGVTSKALMLLLVIAALATYAKVSSNSSAYTNSFVDGLAVAAPQLAGQVIPQAAQVATGNLQSCVQLLGQLNITQSQVAEAFPQSGVTNAINSGGGPIYQGLPSEVQQNVSAAAYAACTSMSAQFANTLKTQVGQQIGSINVTQSAQQVNATAILTPQLLTQVINSVPLLKQMVSLLPIIAALIVISLVSILNIIVHILSVAIVWMLMKAI
jgi:hypothetical protein